ncbi:uncharacterized protein PFLUO_LOCUS2184 [Penicillium psychrofluorescens]|uniref:uncharacterized protein n=1 Tax=Penicillium psychrofluorescens TaxID=3158075 RepID=UPI003CCDF687
MTAFPPRLDSLPFDVFYQIATSLDDRDLIHLSRTNRSLHASTTSDLIARKTVENVLLHSKEGQAAVAAQAGFRKAVGHRFDIHEAVATASPYSVSVLAYGTDFLYRQGVLCYRVRQEIRLLDVHGAARQERVLNLQEVIPRLLGPESAAETQVSLLHYNDGILVFRLHGAAPDDSLVVIDLERRADNNTKRRRLLLHRRVPPSIPIVVRHSRSYLWYGMFTVMGSSEGVWSILGVNLATMDKTECALPRFIAGDLGQTLCFEMYQDHLYAVSTQIQLDVEEDFSSFYHWICLTPGHQGRPWHGRLWRREHREGPINEMWTDLSVRTDEATGRPVILECRREWRDGKSENHRTYYTQSLPSPSEALASLPQGFFTASSDTSDSDNFDDPLLKPFAVTPQPNDQRPEKRLRRHYHPEYDPGSNPAKRHDFIAARTKHRGYHLAGATFVDLVNDPVPQADGVRPRDRLRLRTISRKRRCPVDEVGEEGPPGLLFRPTQTNATGLPVDGSEERYSSRGMHLWPADDAPAALHQLLCPNPNAGSVRAVYDDRSLLYSVSCEGLPPDHQALTLISFDPSIRFPTLTSLRTLQTPPFGPLCAVDPPRPSQSTSSGVHEAPALYLALRRGYWLR